MRVLFVEDDPSVAQMYKLKLELDGYDVEVASDGEQALEVARREAPDIIFLDIRLPKLPVVILSNHSEKQLVERGLQLGALDYLIKTQTTPARLSSGLETWLKE